MVFYGNVVPGLQSDKSAAANKLKKEVGTILRGAAKRLTKGWTKNAFARTAEGKDVSAWSPKAARYCAIGALQASHKSSTAVLAAQRAVENTTLYGDSLIEFNDMKAKNKYQIVRLFNDTLEQIETFDFTPYV